MKILWLSHFLPFPPKGGASQRSYHLLREAAKRHRVTFVSLVQRAKHPSPSDVAAATRSLAEVAAEVTPFDNPSDRSPAARIARAARAYVSSAPYDVASLVCPPLEAHLRALATRERFDIFHVDTVGLVPYAAAVPDVPLILNHHNIESATMQRRADREPNPVKRHYFRRDAKKLARFERVTAPTVRMNLVVSDLDGQRLRSVAPAARVRVVANGVDVDYFSPDPSVARRPRSLVFAGGMNWYPNAEAIRFFVTEVWPILASDDRSRTLAVVGRDPPAELRDATADPRVRAPGFVDDVRPWINEAEVYVCPIRDGGGTRLKILDALAMAKPLVATAMSVEGLDLEPEAHYLRAETGPEFLGQIKRLEADPGLAARLGAAGRRAVVEKYSWSRIGADLDSAYREAVSD